MPETPSDDELFEQIRTVTEAHDPAPKPKGIFVTLETIGGSRCAICYSAFTPEQLDDPDHTYIEVSSWVTGVKKQSPVLRKPTGARAHTECIIKQIDGEAPDQEPLEGF